MFRSMLRNRPGRWRWDGNCGCTAGFFVRISDCLQDPYRLPNKCRDKHRAVEFLVERNVRVSLLQNPDHAKRFQSGRLGSTLGTFKLNDRLRGPRIRRSSNQHMPATFYKFSQSIDSTPSWAIVTVHFDEAWFILIRGFTSNPVRSGIAKPSQRPVHATWSPSCMI